MVKHYLEYLLVPVLVLLLLIKNIGWAIIKSYDEVVRVVLAHRKSRKKVV